MRLSLPLSGTKDRVGARPSRPGRRWLWAIVILALLAGLAAWWLLSRRTPLATSTTATVSQGTMTIAVSGSGSVAAARQLDLAFQQAGTVTAVDVKVGDRVKAGQVLARIDDADLKLQLQQAQASLKAAEAQLAQA